MKKIITLFFAISCCCISIFAQRSNSDNPRGNDKNYFVDIEKLCYSTTNSFEEFKSCVENKRVPVCPKNWDITPNIPCGIVDERDWEKRKITPIYQLQNYSKKNWQEKIHTVEFQNEMPEAFNLR